MPLVTGQVVKLDRGYPLVQLGDGRCVRCKHATDLVKHGENRAVIGDYVELDFQGDVDVAKLVHILPREHVLIRRDPAERTQAQVLAANFQKIVVAQPLAQLNVQRLERELILAYETRAQVAVALTKADLAESEDQISSVQEMVNDMVGDAPVFVVAADDPASVETVRRFVGSDVAVLMGRSGVGKSSLVNLLVGHEAQQTAQVREGDGKGRHTTVSREMVQLPDGGCVVDMPGIRGVGLWDATEGIAAAFSDVVQLAERCKFRDCSHDSEPGCAVREAVEAGNLSPRRLEAYRRLVRENRENLERQEVAQRTKSRRGHPRHRSKR